MSEGTGLWWFEMAPRLFRLGIVLVGFLLAMFVGWLIVRR